jgi:hypothetical protein
MRVVSLGAPYPSAHLQLRGDSVNLTAARGRVAIGLWLLPANACGRGSVVLGSSDALRAASAPETPSEPICAFTQPAARWAEMAATVRSGDPNTQVQLFDQQGTGRPRVAGKLGEECAFSSDAPFFLRVAPVREADVSFDIRYRAAGFTGAFCSLLSVPLVSSDAVEASVRPPMQCSCATPGDGQPLLLLFGRRPSGMSEGEGAMPHGGERGGNTRPGLLERKPRMWGRFESPHTPGRKGISEPPRKVRRSAGRSHAWVHSHETIHSAH